MATQKYYVVWSGKQTGIFNSWETCKEQVNGFKGARYKSYPSKERAEEAYSSRAVVTNGHVEKTQSLEGQSSSAYIQDSISVDAACSGNPGDMEYRAVYTKNSEEIFHVGPLPNGTNNIGEFLAIVHALALLKRKQNHLPIYSDSIIAMNWVRKKHANTTIPRHASTEKVWNLVDRAHKWLENNTYPNKLYKWETKQWGEIKADFGRK